MKTPLDSALKYNWWTPDSKKEDISMTARIEYILKYGSFDELLNLFRTLDLITIEKCFYSIRGDEYHWNKKRRFIIEYIIGLHNQRKHATK